MTAQETTSEPGLWAQLQQWTADHGSLLTWLFVGSIGSLVLCALLLPVIVARLPADYFSQHRVHHAGELSTWRLVGRVAKNLLGLVFVLVGIALLLLPGQGLLTMLIGLLLLEFPGKRALERRIIARPAIRRLMDRIREKRGHAPFVVD
ncbi:MAG: PGPGW domain-containing protein [Planctomycetota bacterium]